MGAPGNDIAGTPAPAGGCGYDDDISYGGGIRGVYVLSCSRVRTLLRNGQLDSKSFRLSGGWLGVLQTVYTLDSIRIMILGRYCGMWVGR